MQARTKNTILQALATLQHHGTTPSVRTVRTQLGGGSHRDIARVLREMRASPAALLGIAQCYARAYVTAVADEEPGVVDTGLAAVWDAMRAAVAGVGETR